MSNQERELLGSKLAKARSYLEYGGGGSTLLAIKKGLQTIATIENNLEWIDNLTGNEHIASAIDEGIAQIHFVDTGMTRDWGYPVDRSMVHNWLRYPFAPTELGIKSVDLVLVDGRWRCACCLAAGLLYTEETSVLLHDYNSDQWRRNYKIAEQYFDVESKAGDLVALRRKRSFNVASALHHLLEVWQDPN